MDADPENLNDLKDFDLVVPKPLRWGLGLFGAVLLVAGAVAVFLTTNGTGSAALIAAGAALIALALLVEQLVSVKALGVSLELRARSKLIAARKKAGQEQEEAAQRLFDEAAELRDFAASAGLAYENLRDSQDSGWERTQKIESLLARTASSAPGGGDAQPIKDIFEGGREGERIVALKLMTNDARLVHLDSIRDAITGPRSNMEQWHALLAAQAAINHGIAPQDKADLLGAVKVALESGAMGRGSDRRKLATSLLAAG